MRTRLLHDHASDLLGQKQGRPKLTDLHGAMTQKPDLIVWRSLIPISHEIAGWALRHELCKETDTRLFSRQGSLLGLVEAYCLLRRLRRRVNKLFRPAYEAYGEPSEGVSPKGSISALLSK